MHACSWKLEFDFLCRVICLLHFCLSFTVYQYIHTFNKDLVSLSGPHLPVYICLKEIKFEWCNVFYYLFTTCFIICTSLSMFTFAQSMMHITPKGILYLVRQFCMSCTELASVAQLDACLTGGQEVAGSIPAGPGNILLWRLIMKYFLQPLSLFHWFKKGSCQNMQKYWLTA